ncbi:GIY-YIG nuclease family protein [Gordonibacter massiliensis (ex Traore et al. 2017)]|uniref:GIY-YIG nuclease family protein n=1 Tax=Gordonibacter massiliensis (ex Traore et al. 2017) TaxID=1841863 RepID=UPI0034A02A4E
MGVRVEEPVGAGASRPSDEEPADARDARRGPSEEPSSEVLPPDEPPAFFVYVLACADGTLYTGYTNDVEQRVRTHNAGKGAKYTRGRTPVEVVAQARFATKHEAMSAEFRFKRLSRAAKDDLLARARTAGFAEALAALQTGPRDAEPADAGADPGEGASR